MKLHELIPYEGINLVVVNDATGNIVVLTPSGAVFNNEDVDDLRNLSVAFGMLTTSDQWRIATSIEVKEFRLSPGDQMLRVEWNTPADEPNRVVPIRQD